MRKGGALLWQRPSRVKIFMLGISVVFIITMQLGVHYHRSAVDYEPSLEQNRGDALPPQHSTTQSAATTVQPSPLKSESSTATDTPDESKHSTGPQQTREAPTSTAWSRAAQQRYQLLADRMPADAPPVLQQLSKVWQLALALAPVHELAPTAREFYKQADAAAAANNGTFSNLLVSANASAAERTLAAFTTTLWSMLTSPLLSSFVLNCQPDASLGTPLPGRYLITATLHSSEAVMPNMVLQLVRLLLWVPPGRAQVVIYQSGGSDRTPMWLDILALALEPLDVTYNITANGHLARQPGQERIAFLSSVRNAVITPTFGAQPRASACTGADDCLGRFEPTGRRD